MKDQLKKLFGLIFGSSIIFSIMRYLNRNKLIVIYYHRITDERLKSAHPDINMFIDKDIFSKQLRCLAKYYRPVSENEVISMLEGKRPRVRYPVWITLDDGYKDNYDMAYPILKEYRIPATFFIITKYVNRNNDYMNWEEIKQLSQDGFHIGAHTQNHAILSQLSKDEVCKEIVNSKKELEENIHKPIMSFAYPHGKGYDIKKETCFPILNGQQIKLAVTTIGGHNNLRDNRLSLQIKRIGVSYKDNLNIFKFKISSGSFWQK